MPQYTLEQRIGVGGMAEVFRARRVDANGHSQVCAVKRLRSDLAGHDDLRQRMLDEAAIARRLHHPGIVDVFDSYELDGMLHLVMEYVDGVSLEHVIARGGAGQFIPLPLAAYVVHELARALDYAHGEGVLHRDVSCSNVLVSANGVVKLTDFGLADAAGRVSATKPGEIIGKWTYLSKRRQRGAPASAQDDVYALGVILGRLLSAADPRERSDGKGARLLALQRRLTEEDGRQPVRAGDLASLLEKETVGTAEALADLLCRPLPRPRRREVIRGNELAGSTLVGPEATRVGRRK